MKVRLAISAALVALVFGTAMQAQNVPAQFVVSGKAAEQIHDFTTINLATAERIAETCERLAAAEGVTISVMVLDNDGNHVYMDRMDVQGYLNIITAEMKARTALLAREPSKARMNRAIQDPNQELQQIQLGFFANAGGLPIIVNQQMIGAVGVGGSGPRPPVWSDEICGHKALVEVIGPSVPPLIEDLPPRANPGRGNAPVPRFAASAPPKPSLPPEFVINAKAAASVYDANQLSLATAKKIARVCRDWAAAKGGSMSLYIINTTEEFVHMERMDGQVFNNIRTALLKAQTALRTRQPTSIRAAQLRNDSSQLARTTMYFDLFTNAGGIPIVVDGQMIGAIGVGGGAGGGDENCAIEGLKAVFGDRVTVPVYPAATAASGGR
jgi:glc operon protein GlcG